MSWGGWRNKLYRKHRSEIRRRGGIWIDHCGRRWRGGYYFVSLWKRGCWLPLSLSRWAWMVKCRLVSLVGWNRGLTINAPCWRGDLGCNWWEYPGLDHSGLRLSIHCCKGHWRSHRGYWVLHSTWHLRQLLIQSTDKVVLTAWTACATAGKSAVILTFMYPSSIEKRPTSLWIRAEARGPVGKKEPPRRGGPYSQPSRLRAMALARAVALLAYWGKLVWLDGDDWLVACRGVYGNASVLLPRAKSAISSAR